MTLVSEAEKVHAEAKSAEEKRRDKALVETVKRLREGFKYRFNVLPDEVVIEGRRPVVVKDGLRFVEHSNGAYSTGWHLLVTCPDCGNEYVSWESMGALKDNYGGRGDDLKTPKERRAAAVAELGKVLARKGRPNGYGHDHKCFDGSTARIIEVARAEAARLKTTPGDLLTRALDGGCYR